MSRKDRQALKDRVEQLFGGWGAHSRLSRGLDIERSTLERIYTGRTEDVPAYVPAVLELLEALPPERWPKRWRE